jgi:5-methylcytosine-specific restriction enzyme subunit McrC
MSSILLYEFGPPVSAELTEDEAAALQACPARLDVRFTRQSGVYELRAAQVVGTIVLPKRTVRIVPKVLIDRLVYLLGFAPETMALLGPTQASEQPDFVEAMKAIYASALQRLLVRGLLREYRVEEEELVSVRGRIDAKDLVLRRFGLFPPIRCRYQEYTIDSEPNRRLLAAAVALGRAGSRRTEASLTLFRLAGRFDGVENSRYSPDRLTPLKRNRLLAHYDPALSIAEAVLRNASLELPQGTSGAMAFVVDMNQVYERFVSRALMAALRLTTREWRMQASPLYLDRDGRLPMRPDILWMKAQGVGVVIDAKYKERTRAAPEDVHQVVAYCSALGLRDAVLLYPDCREEVHVLRTSGVRIHQWRLSLKGTLGDVNAEVERVAHALRLLTDGMQTVPTLTH